ncbi:hypothetical protein LINGRAHAP2_LOCUS33948 [Linum grandiflorum]
MTRINREMVQIFFAPSATENSSAITYRVIARRN